jgi:hypothetical protein
MEADGKEVDMVAEAVFTDAHWTLGDAGTADVSSGPRDGKEVDMDTADMDTANAGDEASVAETEAHGGTKTLILKTKSTKTKTITKTKKLDPRPAR